MNRRRATGFTLIEVLVASAIGAVVAGGSVMAVVAASRMLRAQSGSGSAEAAQYAQQTLERFRNMIACNSSWFNPATCVPVLGPPMDGNWITDPWDPPPPRPGVDSILNTANPKRCYRVQPLDCDGVVGSDCFTVQAQVCWNGEASCPCP